ncbi:MAG: hypothetical protein ACTS2F_25360 [Thainema sp.]
MTKTNHPTNILEVLVLYFAELETQYSPKQAQSIQNETRSALFRFVAPHLGLKRDPNARRMTKAEIQQAEAVLAQASVRWLPKLMQFAERSFREQQTPKSVQQTYGTRIQQLLNSAEKQIWYPGNRIQHNKFAHECADPLPRKFGRPTDYLLVPEKKGLQIKEYSLQPHEISPQLQAQLDQFLAFICDRNYVDRVIKPIDPERADDHVNAIRLFLGWWKHVKQPSLTVNELSLDLIVPKLTDADLDDLTPSQRKQKWRQVNRELKQWILDYFNFLEVSAKSYSPRTRENKLTQILKVAYFQYASEVEHYSEYEAIPLFGALRGLQKDYRDQVKEWTRNRRFVANQVKKWPDLPEGKTALAVLKEGLFEHLRRRCRPRTANAVLHQPLPQAQFLATFLLWAEMLLEPPRRQQELRTRRIALACNIKRPESVPPDGLYHPLPPEELRQRNQDGLIVDNYLCHVYTHNGRHYPDGVWIKQVRKYKTHKHHGPQDIVIHNRPLGDGLQLYDYIERYLYGDWYSGNLKNSITYDWWDSDLQNQRGKWLTKGLLEFEPLTHPLTQEAQDWPWTWMFCIPRTGKPHTRDSLSDLFDRSSHQWIGKRITPHTLRYIWATWAFQVGMADAEIHSLAYAMGSTYDTLRKWYERSTPEDKRRPIEEAIDLYFYDVLGQYQADELKDASPKLKQALRLIQQLSSSERLMLTSLIQAS